MAKVHIFCGTGMGKTSAALGKGIREASEGKSVILVQFMKDKTPDTAADFFRRLEPEMRLFRFERFPGNYESLTDEKREEEIRNIRNGLNFARKVLVTEECDVLILDEILGLVDCGIIREKDVRNLIDAASDDTELYLTGTSKCEKLWKYVDEVTEMTNPKA